MGQQERVEAESAGAGGMGPLKRRGLIAGLAALAAAGLAKLAGPERAEATHTVGGTPNADSIALHVGQFNSTDGQTTLNRSTAGSGLVVSTLGAGSRGVFGSNGTAGGAPGALGGIGILGQSFAAGPNANAVGVLGEVGAASSVGVRGTNFANSASAVAVEGLSVAGAGPGIGVRGKSAGIGVEGDSTNSTGVIGRATEAGNPNPGVIGSATNGYGVFGFSQNSNGIAGQSGTSAAGCVGFAGAPGGYGIYGGIAVQGGYAGGFAGPVLVVGDFTATGGAKSAAVPHPDGTHRRLYCMESPESLFEDFGRGKLANGRAEVRFDPDFAAIVHNDDYHIFLTEYGDSGGLYVANQSSSSFEVRARTAAASGAFGYRVVAKRKDIPGPRLEKVKLPQPIKELVKPELPKPSEPPKAPEPPRPVR